MLPADSQQAQSPPAGKVLPADCRAHAAATSATPDDCLYVWGSNDCGQLGLGNSAGLGEVRTGKDCTIPDTGSRKRAHANWVKEVRTGKDCTVPDTGSKDCAPAQ
eukprot:1151778-Pelagomonas_calceolata.AAC.4